MTASRAQRLSLAAFLLLLAAPAHGLGLVSDDRKFTFDGEVVTPSTPFGPFIRSSITVTSDGLGIVGDAEGFASGSLDENGLHTSEYLFSIDFRIDGAGTLALDACIEVGIFGGPGSGFVRVLAGDQELFAREDSYGLFCQFDDAFHFSTDLAPGVYTIQAEAQAITFDVGAHVVLDFEVRDTANPIPEPATALVLGAGLAGLAATGRAKRTGQRPRRTSHSHRRRQRQSGSSPRRLLCRAVRSD